MKNKATKQKKLTGFPWGNILIAAVTAIVGVCFISYGNDSLDALAVTVGIIVLVAAILLALTALADKRRGFGFGIKIILSVAMIISGTVTLISKSGAIDVIIGIFGLVLILDGAFKFHTTALSKRYHVAGWWIMLVLSVLLVSGGYITVRALHASDSFAVYVIGALFILDSLSNLFSAFYASTVERRAILAVEESILAEVNDKTETPNIKDDDFAKKKRLRKFKR